MVYNDFKDLSTRKLSNKILRDEWFNNAKKLKFDGYQHGISSVVYKFFDKKAAGGANINENMSNKQLAEVLHLPSTLIFIFLWKIKKALELLMLFKKIWKSLIANLRNYG